MTPTSVGLLKSAMTPLIRRTQTFKAVNISEVAHGPTFTTYAVDFGQNAAAMVSVKVPEVDDSTQGTRAVRGAADIAYTLRISCTETEHGPRQGGADVLYTFDAESAARNKVSGLQVQSL
jgi:hypothetical protein